MKIAQILLADAWGGVDAASLERGIGGREGAMIRLAREWARMGHEVTNYVPTREAVRLYEGEGFTEFVPNKIAPVALATFPYDAVVAWECPHIYADDRIAAKQKVRLVEMQCAHLMQEMAEASARYATGVVGLSQWHVDFMAHSFIEGPFHILPNGVDLEYYPTPHSADYRRRRNKQFFYSSSPDRGLWHLLNIWPLIKKRWPEATLKVGYGYERWVGPMMWTHHRQGEMALDIEHMMQQDGIESVGVVGQKELAEIQRNSIALPYTCDTIQPTETGCITAIEAMAAGAPVVTTDCDCLAEEFSEVAEIVPLPFDGHEYFEALEGVIGSPARYRELSERGREFAEGRQWKLIAPRWIELFEAERSRS